MDPRAGLDGWNNPPLPGFDPGLSSPVAQSLYRLSYGAHRLLFYLHIFLTIFHVFTSSSSSSTCLLLHKIITLIPLLNLHLTLKSSRRSQWPRGLKRGSAAACFLGLRVRNLLHHGCPSFVCVMCWHVGFSVSG